MASKKRKRAAVARPPATKAAGPDRCELCGTRLPGSFGAQLGHLRTAHPRYARGLLARIATPFLFLAAIGALAAASAPRGADQAALALAGGMLIAGVLASRSERAHAGLRPAPPFAQVLREGGFRFLLIPVVLLLLLLASRA